MPLAKKKLLNQLFGILQKCIGILPFSMVVWIGKRVGYILQLIDSRRLSITQNNVHFAFPDHTEQHRQSIVRGSYINLGIVFTELLRASTITKEELLQRISIDGLEPIQERSAKGLPTILLSAHYANWEYLAMAAGVLLGTSIGIVAHPQHNDGVDTRLNAIRTKFGNTIIPMGQAAKTLIRTINSGGVLAFLVDQHANPQADPWITFFGRPTPTYEAPAVLALRYNIPIYYGYAERLKNGRYYCSVKPLVIPQEGGEISARIITQKHVEILEDTIRKSPELWSWQHRRWRDLPGTL